MWVELLRQQMSPEKTPLKEQTDVSVLLQRAFAGP